MSPFILIILEINKCLTAAMHAGISMDGIFHNGVAIRKKVYYKGGELSYTGAV